MPQQRPAPSATNPSMRTCTTVRPSLLLAKPWSASDPASHSGKDAQRIHCEFAIRESKSRVCTRAACARRRGRGAVPCQRTLFPLWPCQLCWSRRPGHRQEEAEDAAAFARLCLPKPRSAVPVRRFLLFLRRPSSLRCAGAERSQGHAARRFDRRWPTWDLWLWRRKCYWHTRTIKKNNGKMTLLVMY